MISAHKHFLLMCLYRDVHVIELTGSRAVTSHDKMAALRVIVRGADSGQRRRHVTLLLRIHRRPAIILMRTERLRGALDVIVSVLSSFLVIS